LGKNFRYFRYRRKIPQSLTPVPAINTSVNVALAGGVPADPPLDHFGGARGDHHVHFFRKEASMSNRSITGTLTLLIAGLALASTGCIGITTGPTLGVFSIPVPISPYFQDKAEDKFWIEERYARVPILGPLEAGGPDVALDPPSDDEVMRALERSHKLEGGVPFLHEKQWNNVKIVKEKIADYVDPPRFYPTIGPAQLHHAHYKCTVYFQERVIVSWPVPHTLLDEEAVEVIYIDHNHFHMVGNVDPGVGTQY